MEMVFLSLEIMVFFCNLFLLLFTLFFHSCFSRYLCF